MGINLPKNGQLYFMGIGGTGMAAVAGLMQEAGYKVSGSDKGIYPPMSNMLDELNIEVSTPYAEANLKGRSQDLIIVANALSRGNPEVEYMLSHDLAHTSFPALLGGTVLAEKHPVVVTGTHGKTTTTSIVAHLLEQLGEKPGFLIGGLPRNFSRSFRLGKGSYFAIEGDEYDTAFFDKESKFLHYRPEYLLINNLEFDHADIFDSIEAIEAMFEKLIAKVKDKAKIVANMSDDGVARLIAKHGLDDQVTHVLTKPSPSKSRSAAALQKFEPGATHWTATVATSGFGDIKFKTTLAGEHNLANLTQVIGLLAVMAQSEGKAWSPGDIAAAIESFSGVARRLDLLGEVNGVRIYEDFAHHPTAIQKVIEGVRAAHPEQKFVVAFEPVNATGRRNILLEQFALALKQADEVWLGPSPVDERIAPEDRMNTEALAAKVGSHARAFASNQDLLNHAAQSLEPNTTILFMSPGSFSGIQHQLVEKLKN